MNETSPLLSIVIPALNEAESLPDTIAALHEILKREAVPHEILVVNDHGTDKTPEVISYLSSSGILVRELPNANPPGFGNAIRHGLENINGAVAGIVMADGSDAPEDVVRFYRKIVDEGYDCCFGSRWSRGGKATGYPALKLILNRVVNAGIMLLFGIRYNDVTNAFKMYRREVIQGCQPLLSHHFNLTVELPLKAIVRGYSYAVLPNTWKGRKHGVSRLKLKEMGSRYLFIILYCLLEKWLSRGDYQRKR